MHTKRDGPDEQTMTGHATIVRQLTKYVHEKLGELRAEVGLVFENSHKTVERRVGEIKAIGCDTVKGIG